MLEQLEDGRIVETPQMTSSQISGDCVNQTRTVGQSSMIVGGLAAQCLGYSLGYSYSYPYNVWNGYQVYVCTDKTARAIAILKALQEDKQIQCKSVPKFIALVEKISSIL